MKLSDLRRSGTSQNTPNNPTPDRLEPGTIRNSAVYPRAIEALLGGQPVTVIATGDIVGMSPAVQIVDEKGQIDWVSTDEIIITQRDVLPQSEAVRQRLTQRAGQFAHQ